MLHITFQCEFSLNVNSLTNHKHKFLIENNISYWFHDSKNDLELWWYSVWYSRAKVLWASDMHWGREAYFDLRNSRYMPGFNCTTPSSFRLCCTRNISRPFKNTNIFIVWVEGEEAILRPSSRPLSESSSVSFSNLSSVRPKCEDAKSRGTTLLIKCEPTSFSTRWVTDSRRVSRDCPMVSICSWSFSKMPNFDISLQINFKKDGLFASLLEAIVAWKW